MVGKLADELFQIRGAVGPEARPPDAQDVARDQWRRTAEQGVLGERIGIRMPIAEEVPVLDGLRRPRGDPAVVLPQHHSGAVIEYGPAVYATLTPVLTGQCRW